MPRNVRNFFVNLSVDGRRTDISTGPRSWDGEIRGAFYLRHEGGISDVHVSVRGQALANGELSLTFEVFGNEEGVAVLSSDRFLRVMSRR